MMPKLSYDDVIRIVSLAHNRGQSPDFNGLDLSHLNLQGADLHGTNFRGADLRGTNFRAADLSRSNLSEVNLSWANLSWANLKGANLTAASLDEANLSQANLTWANLNRAHLNRTDIYRANFHEAIIAYTIFANIDFSSAIDLETVEHYGPSSIDLHALTRSQGKVPDIFLRGAGISNCFISYLPSLTNQAIQYYSCFISYSHQDEAFAQRLHADLQNKGVRCWYAPEDLKIGDRIRPAIDRSIRLHDKLLLILSENSIYSDWVAREVETAFEEEKKRQETVLFPVRLDGTVMKTDQVWAADIRRTRYIGEFNNWKTHEAYQIAFKRLLRDLNSKAALASPSYADTLQLSPDEVESLGPRLMWQRIKLDKLKKRAAAYPAGNPPQHLLQQIEIETSKIAELEAQVNNRVDY